MVLSNQRALFVDIEEKVKQLGEKVPDNQGIPLHIAALIFCYAMMQLYYSLLCNITFPMDSLQPLCYYIHIIIPIHPSRRHLVEEIKGHYYNYFSSDCGMHNLFYYLLAFRMMGST
jgi:hypothetical protein